MRKHLITAVGARQVELPWRSRGDRMEIPSDCQHAGGVPVSSPNPP